MDKDPDYNVFSRSSTPGPKRYFCNNCCRSLFLNDKETQEYICTNCNITFYPNHQIVKQPDRFDLPGPQTDIHGNVIGDSGPIIAAVDDPNKKHLQPFTRNRS